jgi:hypothetical protein
MLTVAVCVGAVAGCDRLSGPSGAVLSRYEAGERAIAAGNGMEFFKMMSAESQAAELELIQVALTGSSDKVRALPPSSIALVLALRNRVEPSRLRKMTVEDLAAWQIESKLLGVDADNGYAPVDVTVTGDKAYIQMGIKEQIDSGGLTELLNRSSVEPIKNFEYHYVRVNGEWLIDKAATDVALKKVYAAAAREAGVKIVDMIEAQEREEFGSLKPNIWSPVGK